LNEAFIRRESMPEFSANHYWPNLPDITIRRRGGGRLNPTFSVAKKIDLQAGEFLSEGNATAPMISATHPEWPTLGISLYPARAAGRGAEPTDDPLVATILTVRSSLLRCCRPFHLSVLFPVRGNPAAAEYQVHAQCHRAKNENNSL
jgi:hypothetical protein